MVVSVHLEDGSITRTVLAEMAEQQMNLAVLRLECIITQIAIVNYKSGIRVEVVGTGIGIIAPLHVLPP